MPFNALLLVSLISDTHFSESGVEVSMVQKSGEKLLFFKMDQPIVREALHIEGHICDGLVCYFRGNEKIFCLVELKGCRLDTAVDQIINTHKHLKSQFTSSLDKMNHKKYLHMITWKAYVCSRGSTPKELSHYKKTLDDTFGKGNYGIRADKDLGKFLRDG
jgi:hypothetical protein